MTAAYEDDAPAVFVVALGHAIKHKGVAQVAEAATQVGHIPSVDARIERAFVSCCLSNELTPLLFSTMQIYR